MPSVVEVNSPSGKWTYDFSIALGADASVTANADGTTTTAPSVTCVKAATGTYTVTIPGNFYAVACKMAELQAATPTAAWAAITAVGLGTGTADATGGSTTTLTIKTMDDNATPTAADVAAVSSIECHVSFIKNKI